MKTLESYMMPVTCNKYTMYIHTYIEYICVYMYESAEGRKKIGKKRTVQTSEKDELIHIARWFSR